VPAPRPDSLLRARQRLQVALARLIAAASRFGAVHADRLEELDLNPVLASPEGAVAVDWLMVLRG